MAKNGVTQGDNSSKCIIKEPSAKLFDFSEIRLYDSFVESIQSEAQFLFVNLKRLHLNIESFEEIAYTIDQFEKINLNSNTIDHIQLNLDNSKVHEENFELLAKYRIQKLQLTKNKIKAKAFHRMKGNLNFVTELNLAATRFYKPDEKMLEFCAQLF